MDAEAGNKYRARRGGGIGEGYDEASAGGLVRSDAGNNKLIAGGGGGTKDLDKSREETRSGGNRGRGGRILSRA